MTTVERQQLYEALVRMCQTYGYTTGETYDHLHAAVASITNEAAEIIEALHTFTGEVES